MARQQIDNYNTKRNNISKKNNNILPINDRTLNYFTNKLPSDFYNIPSNFYPYYNNLFIDYLGIKNKFNYNIDNIVGLTIDANIPNAMNFLLSAIQTEYAKEMRFINKFKNKLSNDSSTEVNKLISQIPTCSEDWSNFIKTFWDAIDKSGLIPIRLKEMQTRLTQIQKSQRTSKSKDALSNLLNSLQTAIPYNLQHPTDIDSSQIVTIITQLIQSSEDFQRALLENTLTDAQLFAISLAVTIEIYRQIQSNLQLSQGNYRTISAKQVEEHVKQLDTSSIMHEEIINLINTLSLNPKIANNFLQAFGIDQSNLSNIKKQLSADLTKTIQRINDFFKKDQTGQWLQSVAKTIHGITVSNKISAQNARTAMSELQSVIIALMQNSLTLSPGASGNKDDSIYFRLTIPFDEIDSKIRSRLFTEFSSIKDTLTSVNNTEYYLQQGEIWENLQKTLSNILQEEARNKEKEYIERGFIIEDSTKYYKALYDPGARGGLQTSMHGGSLGTNIYDQITRIAKLQQQSSLIPFNQFSQSDIEWLTSIAINSGDTMPASSKKNNLERYFATFASILLFDSQFVIAKEATQQLASTISGINTDVDILHVFSTNDGYFPLSYVLQLTYDQLSKATLTATGLIDSGTTISLATMQEPYEYPLHIDWDQLRKNALSTTDLEIHFLNNFLQILNQLFPNPP